MSSAPPPPPNPLGFNYLCKAPTKESSEKTIRCFVCHKIYVGFIYKCEGDMCGHKVCAWCKFINPGLVCRCGAPIYNRMDIATMAIISNSTIACPRCNNQISGREMASHLKICRINVAFSNLPALKRDRDEDEQTPGSSKRCC